MTWKWSYIACFILAIPSLYKYSIWIFELNLCQICALPCYWRQPLWSVYLNRAVASALRYSNAYGSASAASRLKFSLSVLISCDTLTTIRAVPGERAPWKIPSLCHLWPLHSYSTIFQMWFQPFDGVNHGQLVLTCKPYSGRVATLVTLHPALRFLQKKHLRQVSGLSAK